MFFQRVPGILASDAQATVFEAERTVQAPRVPNSLEAGSLWASGHPPCSVHLLSQEGLSGDAPLFSGQEEGGGQGIWLVPKPGNKSTSNPASPFSWAY